MLERTVVKHVATAKCLKDGEFVDMLFGLRYYIFGSFQLVTFLMPRMAGKGLGTDSLIS